MNREPEEDRILERIEADEREQISLERQILQQLTPVLSFIKIAFQRGDCMAEGPVTLAVGQKTVASIDGFDQNGAPFLGAIPTPTWAIDNSAFATIAPDGSVPANEDVTAVSAGVANLNAQVTNSAGTLLQDTETVTVTAAAQVLSSIKINFTAPQ